MRIVILVVTLALTVGCFGSITGRGVSGGAGQTTIGYGCDVEGNCEERMETKGFSPPFLDVVMKAVMFFVPAGLQSAVAVPPHTHDE